MILRTLKILAITAVASVSAYAEGVKFTPAALEAAQKSEKPILVEIKAPWCPVCKAQKPIIEKLTSSDKFKNLVVLDVDFDNQKDVVRDLKATKQSTLIVFKGKTEVGRSTGDSNAASIEGLLAKAL